MLKEFITKAKKLCDGCIDDDEVCIFLIAFAIGFLLCFFVKGREPFDNWYADVEEVEKNDTLTGTPSSGSPPKLGMDPKKNMNRDIPPSLKNDYNKVQASKQYPSKNIQNVQGLKKMDNAQFKPFQGWDYNGYAPVDMMFNLGPGEAPKNMGRGPMGPDRPMMPSGAPMMPSEAPMMPSEAPKGGGGELKIVLIYADWCGHSKKMLPDFQKIEAEFSNKNVNGSVVLIEKYTDKDKAMVEKFGVKGFPTLFSIKNGQQSPLNERSYEGIKNHIMKHA